MAIGRNYYQDYGTLAPAVNSAWAVLRVTGSSGLVTGFEGSGILSCSNPIAGNGTVLRVNLQDGHARLLGWSQATQYSGSLTDGQAGQYVLAVSSSLTGSAGGATAALRGGVLDFTHYRLTSTGSVAAGLTSFVTSSVSAPQHDKVVYFKFDFQDTTTRF